MNALETINRLVEAEDPKGFIKRVLKQQKPQFEVGYEVISGTGITRDIMDACLTALKELDRNAFLQEISDSDVFNYSTLGEADPDFDPDYYTYEHLFNRLQKYCPPLTYFGSREADGAIGCWPPDSMAIDDLVAEGKATYVGENETLRAHQIHQGDFTTVDAPYVLIEYDGDLECWSKATRQKLWHY